SIKDKTVTSVAAIKFEYMKLNPQLTFETFVVGESNQFAYTVARSVAENPSIQYNPFFIYGAVGLGKTHLLQAIGNYGLKLGKSVIYTTLEEFTNIFISHIRTQTMDRFRDTFRRCDLLLIDDIQFLGGKEKTQDEFFHTFNKLHSEGKQIVLTSDKAPKKIAGLEERLISRFEWGLMADIQAPNLEMKISIIKKKCETNQIHLNEDIVHYIATHLGDNIREIEEVIIKINALRILLHHEITLDFVQNAIKDHIKEKTENISIDDIVETVAKEFNVKPSEIKSKRRHKAVVEARRVVVYLARNLTLNSMPQLAFYFGLKDHSSISHMMTKVYKTMDADTNFKILLEELAEKISTKKDM
ncbi:MAG: chromosomal replication initiator protein DnaA, partial [Campylobacterota bacterium]|nr:chromosomal replication initiator protein DnaA [Campylobacterota bacterium]